MRVLYTLVYWINQLYSPRFPICNIANVHRTCMYECTTHNINLKILWWLSLGKLKKNKVRDSTLYTHRVFVSIIHGLVNTKPLIHMDACIMKIYHFRSTIFNFVYCYYHLFNMPHSYFVYYTQNKDIFHIVYIPRILIFLGPFIFCFKCRHKISLTWRKYAMTLNKKLGLHWNNKPDMIVFYGKWTAIHCHSVKCIPNF